MEELFDEFDVDMKKYLDKLNSFINSQLSKMDEKVENAIVQRLYKFDEVRKDFKSFLNEDGLCKQI